MKIELSTRKHPRLKGYDYSRNGAYFVTICTQNRKETLGAVGRGDPDAPFVHLSEYGIISRKCIEQIESHYDGVIVDKYVVMPNHIHMILIIDIDENLTNKANGASGSPRPTIPNIIRVFKRLTNRELGLKMWQTSYHDHIIRNEAEYLRIWQYIDENAAKWDDDEYYMQ